MKQFLAIILALAISIPAAADDGKKGEGYVFTDGKILKTTSVKDQYRSGTCWCYSGLSFLENEILRKSGEEMDLSAMWIVRNIYFEKAVKYVRLHGSLNFAVGGSHEDVIHGIKEYGIVPTEVYPGFNYGTAKPEFGEIDAVLRAYVDAIIKNRNRRLTTAWQAGLNGILDSYFGVRPEKFTYKGKEYTPKSFAESLPIDLNEYISITSFTHHPFYTKFVLEIPDNWQWSYSYNVPMDELIQIVDNSLANGYTVGWGTDVSEKTFSRKKAIGIIIDDPDDSLEGTDAARWSRMSPEEKDDEIFKTPRKEKEITQEMRQMAFDNYQTTDDHGMVIVGDAKDQTGGMFYKVKNSWGERGPYKGFYYFSKTFVAYKTTDIMVNVNAVPKPIRKKLGL